MKFQENLDRSVIKSITFRLVIIVSDIIIFFVVTRRYDMTIGLTVISNMASTVLYFLHERAWNNVYWGKKTKE